MTFYEKDGAFWMTSYTRAQKIVNIRCNPHVGLMIEAGESYGELQGVMVRGTCELIEGVEAVEAVFVEMAQRRDPTSRGPSARVRSRRSASCSKSSPIRYSAGTTVSSVADTDPTVIPGRAKGASPEPMNTVHAKGRTDGRATSRWSVCSGSGFLRFAQAPE